MILFTNAGTFRAPETRISMYALKKSQFNPKQVGISQNNLLSVIIWILNNTFSSQHTKWSCNGRAGQKQSLTHRINSLTQFGGVAHRQVKKEVCMRIYSRCTLALINPGPYTWVWKGICIQKLWEKGDRLCIQPIVKKKRRHKVRNGWESRMTWSSILITTLWLSDCPKNNGANWSFYYIMKRLLAGKRHRQHGYSFIKACGMLAV